MVLSLILLVYSENEVRVYEIHWCGDCCNSAIVKIKPEFMKFTGAVVIVIQL